MVIKRFYHPEMSSGVIRPTCAYGYVVDGVTPNTNPTGHLNRLAIDEGGEAPGSTDYLAVPKQGAALQCVRITNKGDLNVAMFETTEEVLCADGEICVAGLECIHIGNQDFADLGIEVGKTFQPGQQFYRKGCGGTNASHVHIQAYKGNTGGTWHHCSSGFAMDGEAPLNKIAFLPAGAVVRPNGFAYQWEEVKEDPIGTLTVTGEVVNVRTKPDKEAPKCDSWKDDGHVLQNHRYAVYETADGWVRIGRDRWISAEFCDVKLEEKPKPTPVPAKTTRYLVTVSEEQKEKLMALVEELHLECVLYQGAAPAPKPAEKKKDKKGGLFSRLFR